MFEEAFRRGIAAVEPRMAVRAELERMQLDGPVTVIAIGKAAPAMAQGAIDILENRVVGGIVVSHAHQDSTGQAQAGPSSLRYLEGGHPIPTIASLQAGEIVMAEAAGAIGTLLILVSGGASSLVEVPLEGLTLTDLATSYRLLLQAGLPIEKLNTVRRHLSAVKNGGVLAASHVNTVSLLIADVAGADASAIASGPTMADSSVPADALGIIEASGLLGDIPVAVVDALRAPRRPPAPSPPHRWAIVTDSTAAARAASVYIRECGFATEIDPNPLGGDAAEEATRMASSALASTVTLRHGETVVKVRGDTPGGRNQHAALAAAGAIDRQVAVFAALATDGRDGLTDVAGAIVDGQTCDRLRAAGVDPQEMLTACRSHDALEASGDLIITGATGTNVADIWMSWRQGP